MIIVPFQTREVPSHWATRDELRLDASFYSQQIIAARLLMGKISQKTKTVKLVDLVGAKNIYMPALKVTIPFSDYGYPYLTQSEVEFFLPASRKRVDVKKIDDADRWKVRNGYILVSQSGTIGRLTIATSYLENFIISPNPIRIIANRDIRGFLYAFLSTWVGNAFVKSPSYGITVNHILPHQLHNIPIPQLDNLQEEINNQILDAQRHRETGQQLLMKAQVELKEMLGLATLEGESLPYLVGEIGRTIKSFEISSSKLELRLDASYHAPILQTIRNTLAKAKFDTVKLGLVCERISVPNRFRRHYVEDTRNGVPFLQGSHIPQTKPTDVKYISIHSSHIKDVIIKRNWVLLTRSGTVGRIAIVREGLDNWAASEHLYRIVTKPEIHPGYVAAFLSSTYGRKLIEGKTYGAVVDEIGEKDTSLIEDIDIVLPPKRIRDTIGEITFAAYDEKDKANRIEEEAIRLLEYRLKEIVNN
ncbi:MAG: restriction endonuclease subunit S [Dehalococcoidia bacterium]|nr:restriction endonuclease subunit S [Dehalococcoidia bacterium]